MKVDGKLGERINKNSKIRESGIELLRILMMIQVIYLHVCKYGNWNKYAEKTGGMTELCYWFFWLLCRCPVYVYIAILGYFMVSKDISMKEMFTKIKSTYLVLFFYSMLITFVAILCGQLAFASPRMIKGFLPFFSRSWYFITLYILVLFFAPFLNKCLKVLTKKEYQIIILGLFIVLSIWPMLAKLPPIKDVVGVKLVISTEGGKSLYDFIFMYILGGYLFLHVRRNDKVRKRYLLAFITLGILNTLILYTYPDYQVVVGYNSNPLAILQVVCLILYFRELKFKSKTINAISKNNIGVYILHESAFGRWLIWNKALGMISINFYASKYYPIKIMLGIIGIFIVCSFIEYLRQQFFEIFSKRKKYVTNIFTVKNE